MIRGRKPTPAAMRGRSTPGEPVPPMALPRCPDHLCDAARREWRRLAKPLFDMGVLTAVDRGALAAYCQAWARWGAVALAVLLFLLSIRRTGKRAGRMVERIEAMEATNDIQRRMLDAAAHRPLTRNELARRLRDGRF